MVTINHEVLDHLPYTDMPIIGSERAAVEQLISHELDMSRTSDRHQPPQHSMVDSLVPLPDNGSAPSLALKEIERYENELEDHEDLEGNAGTSTNVSGSGSSQGPIIQGIDSDRYIDGSSVANTDSDAKVYESLYYSLNEVSNLSALVQNADDVAGVNQQYYEDLNSMHQHMTENVDKKRKQVNEINSLRKKRQTVDFKPVNDYLANRWKDGIKSVVDLGIEAATNE